MESPLRERGVTASTSRNEETKTGSGEPRYAELELEQDQERSIAMPASRNEEYETDNDETDSDEQDKERSVPFSTSRNEESDTDSGEQAEGRSVPISTSRNEESNTDSSEQDEGRSLPVSISRTEESYTDSGESSNGDLKIEQGHVNDIEGSSSTGVLDDQTLAEEEEGERDGNGNMQEEQSSSKASADERYEPSLSVDEVVEESIEISPDIVESNKQVLGDNAGTPFSTVDEKNEGGKGVSLQSLKAPTSEESKPSSSQVNVARDIGSESVKYRMEDEHAKKGFTCDGNTEEEDERLREYWTRALQTSTSTGQVVEEIVKVLKHHQDTHDLLCPVCGSCVTRRVILRKRKRSSLIPADIWYPDPVDETEVQEQVMEAVEEQDPQEYQDTKAFGCLACFSLFLEKGCLLLNRLQADIGSNTFNCLPFFFPPYPWGMTQMKQRSAGLDEEVPSLEEIEELEEPSTTDASSTFTCGIGSTLLPDYPWGTMPLLSKGEQIRGSEDAGAFSQPVEGPQPLSNESSCMCELAPALFPDYPWGYLSKVEEVPLQSPSDLEAGLIDSNFTLVKDADLQGVSQPEISEEPPQLRREERNCTCGLVPALLPDYPWGFFVKDEGAYNVETGIEPQAKTVEETEGKAAEDIGPSCDPVSVVLPDYPWGITTESGEVLQEVPILGEESTHVRFGSAVLPSYPWGICSVNRPVHEQNGSAQMHQDPADRDCTCGLGLTMLPKFPWGQPLSTEIDKEDQTGRQQVEYYIEQETKQETRITSQTDLVIVTTSESTYPGKRLPQNITTMIPQQTSQTIQHVKLDQTVTFINTAVKVEEASEIKGSPLAFLPSTGFALLEEDLDEKGRLETRPSTGYAYLNELSEEAESTHPSKPAPTYTQLEDYKEELPKSEIEEDPVSHKFLQPAAKSESTLQSIPEKTFNKHGKIQFQVSGTQFPSFQWSVGKLDAGDLTTPLLKASVQPEAETFISVSKPTPGGVEKPKSKNLFSIFKVWTPSAPLLSTNSGYIEEIGNLKRPVVQPQIQSVIEAVIDVPHGDLGGTSVETTGATAVAVPTISKTEADEWDILKCIVYGGLDISVASLGVTSSAAGGNAITRTVVYMGVATLLSGLIGFYHNVLNLYHHHRDHYTEIVGLSLMLHGTVALISYIVFGLLSPLIYAFSYRETDDRDDKFMLCCGASIVTVTALALGKARVSNKRYLRTLFAYLSGGVLAAIIGYLTGEHVAELLEEWGI